MDGLESVIAGAVAEAKAGGMEGEQLDYSGEDTGGEPETVDPAGDAGEAESAAPASEAAPAAAAAPVEGAESKPEPVKEEKEDAFAAEHGIKEKEASGRENRIPYSRVKTISENAVKKARASWEAETLKPLQAELQEHRVMRTTVGEFEHIMRTDSKRFLGMLQNLQDSEGNYVYESVLGRPGSGAPNRQQAESYLSDSGELDFSKAPAGDHESGGYTPEGLQRLLAWTVNAATQQAEARITKRYEGMESSFKRARAQSERSTAQMQAADNEIRTAMTWRGFEQNYDKILDALQKDTAESKKAGQPTKFRSLRDAYEHVVFGDYESRVAALTTDHNKVREQVLAEMKSAPRQTAVGGAGQSRQNRQQLDQDASMEDVIKHAIDTSGIRGKRV